MPEVAGFLGQPPAVFGAAVTALFRITREFPKPDYDHWAWLSRRYGGFPVGVAHPGYIERAFYELTLLILRRRIEIADAAMAELVRQAVTAMRLPSPWRSRHFLNQAIKIATGADGAATRAALLWLATRETPISELAIPDDWTHPIEQAVGNTAPDAALAVPELDLTMSGSPFVTRSHPEVVKLVRHFQPSLDPRLHDAAHRALLADLPVRVAQQLAHMELDPARLAAMREKLLVSPKGPGSGRAGGAQPRGGGAAHRATANQSARRRRGGCPLSGTLRSGARDAGAPRTCALAEQAATDESAEHAARGARADCRVARRGGAVRDGAPGGGDEPGWIAP